MKHDMQYTDRFYLAIKLKKREEIKLINDPTLKSVWTSSKLRLISIIQRMGLHRRVLTVVKTVHLVGFFR